MKTLTRTIIASGILLATALPTFAHEGGRSDRLYDRMERQQARIEHGIDNGELTRKEAKSLKRQQREIRHLVWDFRDDGYLSKHERRKLRDKLDRASHRIWKLKHNERSRHGKPNRHYGYGKYDDRGWNDDHGSHRHRHTYRW